MISGPCLCSIRILTSGNDALNSLWVTPPCTSLLSPRGPVTVGKHPRGPGNWLRGGPANQSSSKGQSWDSVKGWGQPLSVLAEVTRAERGRSCWGRGWSALLSHMKSLPGNESSRAEGKTKRDKERPIWDSPLGSGRSEDSACTGLKVTWENVHPAT